MSNFLRHLRDKYGFAIFTFFTIIAVLLIIIFAPIEFLIALVFIVLFLTVIL